MNSKHLSYEIIDHTADLGIVVKGGSIKELFVNAANAMTDLMVKADISGKGAKRRLIVEGEDLADLMVRWLSEILYLFNGEHILVMAIELGSMGSTRLQSKLNVLSLNKGRHEILREIKAVTYHQIAVEKTPDGWEARVIFDI
jgi:SHS2 domain-containing protein